MLRSTCVRCCGGAPRAAWPPAAVGTSASLPAPDCHAVQQSCEAAPPASWWLSIPCEPSAASAVPARRYSPRPAVGLECCRSHGRWPPTCGERFADARLPVRLGGDISDFAWGSVHAGGWGHRDGPLPRAQPHRGEPALASVATRFPTRQPASPAAQFPDADQCLTVGSPGSWRPRARPQRRCFRACFSVRRGCVQESSAPRAPARPTAPSRYPLPPQTVRYLGPVAFAEGEWVGVQVGAGLGVW